MEQILRRAAPADIARAVEDRRGQETAYLERVRAATKALAAPDVAAGDARGALADVERHAGVDPDPPTVSRRLVARLARYAFRRLTGWDLRYLGAQVTVLGHAVVRFGTAIVERTERLEDATGRVGNDVAALAARVERLERDAAGR